jgi:hypothetical protein
MLLPTRRWMAWAEQVIDAPTTSPPWKNLCLLQKNNGYAQEVKGGERSGGFLQMEWGSCADDNQTVRLTRIAW